MDNWYLVKVGPPLNLNYLIMGENEREVMERVKLSDEENHVYRVNWNTMQAITGCMIPERYHGGDWATGPICHVWKDSVVMMLG